VTPTTPPPAQQTFPSRPGARPAVELRSDNAAPVAPQILAAVSAANTGTALAYGADPVTAQLQERVREVFEHPTARVFPVTSGTAANALALSAMCPPWGAVLCHDSAHILTSECGATSGLSAGAVLRGVAGDEFKVSPVALGTVLDGVWWGDPHHSQPCVLSLTQPTDRGTLYTVEELRALSALASRHRLTVHLDGARFANALAALNVSPADGSWRAGVAALSLGATKNGALSAEAIVVFDEAVADELVYRTKRTGHVTSKMRFQSAQLLGYLADDLWLRMAADANAAMARLAAGIDELGLRLIARPAVNIAFVEVDDDLADRLAEQVLFYRMGAGVIRFVTNWQTSEDDVDRTLQALADALR
jgi:threonine aldolase